MHSKTIYFFGEKEIKVNQRKKCFQQKMNSLWNKIKIPQNIIKNSQLIFIQNTCLKRKKDQFPQKPQRLLLLVYSYLNN